MEEGHLSLPKQNLEDDICYLAILMNLYIESNTSNANAFKSLSKFSSSKPVLYNHLILYQVAFGCHTIYIISIQKASFEERNLIKKIQK